MQMIRSSMTAAACFLSILSPLKADHSPNGLSQPDESLPPKLQISNQPSLADEAIAISVTGALPGQILKLTLQTSDDKGSVWESSASYIADCNGAAALDRSLSISGTYEGVDPMGLFWSMRPQREGVFSFKCAQDALICSLKLWSNGECIDSALIKRIRKLSSVQRIEVKEMGIVGTLFLPQTDQKLPVVITLTGSNGGISENRAQALANHGFAALALGYFGAEGLPARLENIPLEYFGKAFQWIAAHPKLDSDRIGIFAPSRGGELSLLLGTVFPEKIKAICAIAPSSAVNGALAEELCDAWSWRDRPLGPFAPVPELKLQGDEGKDHLHPVATTRLFLEGMQEEEAFERAAIPVEKLCCPLMVVCGGDDQMWPSVEYARRIQKRLKERGSPIPFELLEYPKAGHGISIPYLPTLGPEYFHPVGKIWFTLGGTAQEDDLASRDAWEKMLRFFKENLPPFRQLKSGINCCETLLLNPFGEDMPQLAFAPTNHPILRTPAEEVPLGQIPTPEIQWMIDEMFAIASGERSDVEKRVMVGLAAPQVGVGKRIILVDLGIDANRKKLGALQAYINPKIIWKSEETELGREGCYSTDRFHAVVPRSSKVRVCAFDREGNFIVEEHEGFTARIFQHEIDHLEGIRFPERIGPEGRLLWVEEEEINEYRANWQNWPTTRPYSLWVQMSGVRGCLKN